MPIRRLLRLTRPLQVGFIVLLAVCTAQLAYWMVDEVVYTTDVRAQLRNAYEAEAEAARAMLRSGWSWADITRLHPGLAIAADSQTVTVAPSVLQMLDENRFHRLNRYAWEGAFFLAVLLAAMAVVYWALREEADLRRRQEQFLAAVSHELKSPLASLRLSVDTLQMRDPPATRRTELVSRLSADLKRMERMIGNILDTSRLSAAETHTAPASLVLAEEVAAVIDEVREHAAEHETTLATAVPPALVIRADQDSVRTVLRNLLYNAVKATTGGGNVTLRASKSDGQVRLEVRDDGVGFPPDEASRLFEKFYRVESDSRARMTGTGLGLYLVWRCVELDGGTVAASSAGPGCGAVFTVTWPAAGGNA